MSLRRLTYALPMAVIGGLAWHLGLAWWSTAMLAGGALFVLGYLWGDSAVLQQGHGMRTAALGLLCLAGAAALAWRLGIGLAEFQDIQRVVDRRIRVLYQLPGFGVALLTYGLVVWSRAWARDREAAL